MVTGRLLVGSVADVGGFTDVVLLGGGSTLCDVKLMPSFMPVSDIPFPLFVALLCRRSSA